MRGVQGAPVANQHNKGAAKMRTRRLALWAAVVCGLALGRGVAQDPLAVAPEMYRLLFENERVRVMEVTFKPGQKIAPHSHPDHYVYVAEGGKLRISKPDAEPADVEVKPGDVLWIGAEKHWAENTGTTQVRLIVNELKAKPAAAAAAAVPK